MKTFSITNIFYLIIIPSLFLTSCEGAAMDISYIKVCNNTSPVSIETMNQVLIHKRLIGNETNNFKCFLHCLFTKYNWMDDEGGFLLHEMKNVLDQTVLDTVSVEFVLYSCTALRSVDKCERAFLFVECFWKRTHQPTSENKKLFHMLEEAK